MKCHNFNSDQQSPPSDTYNSSFLCAYVKIMAPSVPNSSTNYYYFFSLLSNFFVYNNFVYTCIQGIYMNSLLANKACNPKKVLNSM